MQDSTRGKDRLSGWLQRREAALTEWEHAKPGRCGRACYRAYTHLFVPLVILVLIGLFLNGRELIWTVDGLGQYYPFFVYEGEWIRGIVSRLFGGEGLAVPLWEWASGYGADVPTTFDVFLDPFNLVSAVTPGFLSEWVFQLLIVVRLYLAGLAFIFYCRTRGENKTGTVLGALLYALCGSGLTVVQWTSGLHAFILFPVVLAGAERVLHKGKPWVLIASLTLLAVVSYYFTYMACFLLVGYLAIRVVMLERPNLTVGRFFRWVGIFLGLIVLCLALAGFVLVPAVSALLGMDRVSGQEVSIPLLYSVSYYLKLPTMFLSTIEVGSDTYIGFGGLAFFACLVLFAEKKTNRELKVIFAVLTAFMLLPCVGSFFNGLNYVTNRWAWAYALCVAFVLVRTTPALLALDARRKRVAVIGAVVYAVLLIATPIRTEANMAGFAALLVVLIVLLTVKAEARRRMLGCALALTLIVNGFYFLAPSEGGRGATHVPLGTAYSKLTKDSVDSLALATGDDSWWRYDAGQVASTANAPESRIRNNSVVLGVQGIDFYNSVYDNAVDRFHTELAIAGDDINFSYLNLQGRADLMALLGVRYYAYRNDGTDRAPYGFSVGSAVVQRPVLDVEYGMLRSNVALPLGSTFDKAILRDDYLALSPAQRQQALLQAVVLDEPTAREVSNAQLVDARELSFEDSRLPFSVSSADGVRVEDGSFVAERAGASVTMSFEGVANADTYLYISGLVLHAIKPSDMVSDEAKASMTWYRRANLMLQDLSYVAPIGYEITVKSDASPSSGYIVNGVPGTHMYGGKDTWLVDLGYAESAATAITISFNVAGKFSFDDLQVIAQKHELTDDFVRARSAETLQNVSIGPNRLTASIGLDEGGLIFLPIAKGEGWTALVDGEPANLIRADTAFMALDVSAGQHSIELNYFTPGLLQGFMVTGVGVIALVVLALVMRLRRPKTGDKAVQEANSENGEV